jgi:AcrR family transcriptional regulator
MILIHRNVTTSRYPVKAMGRPKEHDEETRAALRAAAERLVAEGGADALSVRRAAAEVGTTTRAVYSLFGSKEGLVAAVAQTAFEYLHDEIDRLPKTDDSAADLIAIGTDVVRRLALDHPGLFRIAFQRVAGLHADPGLVAAREKAWVQLQAAVQRLKDADSSAQNRSRTRLERSTPCGKASPTRSSAARSCASCPLVKKSAHGLTP